MADPYRSCLIIAEAGLSHDGSLGNAHVLIDAIARAGAGAVKFQTHLADCESTLQEPWRVRFSYQDTTRYGYWKRTEFTEEQWHGLKRHADEAGLLFLSTPFSIEAVEMLSRVGVAAWKVPSGLVANPPILECMARSGQPFLLSCGLSPLEEIDQAVERIQALGVPLTVLQCTTEYPCPPERLGLNLIPFFRERYRCPIGLSDHSGTIYAGLAAAALGIEVLEVHVVFSREMFGPDVAASLTAAELAQLVEGVRFIEKALANPVNKDAVASEKAELRRMFGMSVVARCDLPLGTVLCEEHLTLKKPGIGLTPDRMKGLMGRRTRRLVAEDSFLAEDDFE